KGRYASAWRRSSHSRRPSRLTTTATPGGWSSTRGCSSCPRMACSTRCGGLRAYRRGRLPPGGPAPLSPPAHRRRKGGAMADNEGRSDGDRFLPSVPARSEPYPLKGASGVRWGMQSRLARVFRPADGRTVMLAIDHGYFQGPTSGLERVDLSVVPLLRHADALMATRGMVRSTIPPASGTPIVLRASGGPSILKELSDEQIAVSMEDAVRINACAVAVQVFIGGEFETQSVGNMTRLVDEGQRYGVPVLAVTAVGKELTRDARYLRLATRICAELGAHVVKTYYCAQDFATVTAACPVPIVMAGGKKLPQLEALTMAYPAITEGAAGVDMGRNIFQSESPAEMIQAVGAIVHQLAKPQAAFDQYVAPAAQQRQPEENR